MNLKTRPRLMALSLTSLCIFSLAGCNSVQNNGDLATTSPVVAPKEPSAGTALTAESNLPAVNSDLWAEITSGYGLPHVDDAKVAKHLRWYSNNQKYLDRVTEQSKPYLHYVATQLQDNDLPLELALLPIVESAYNPFAASPSKALGIWQFISQSGRNIGLKQNLWYDGRPSIVASTDAAVRYFKRLHTMFNGDWLLAVAAYNAGEGTGRRAIARNRKLGKDTDFSSLPLSQQTQSYVPQLLALSKVIADPKKYDLELNQINNNPYFTTVNVSTPIDLAQAARMADIDPKELRNRNAG